MPNVRFYNPKAMGVKSYTRSYFDKKEDEKIKEQILQKVMKDFRSKNREALESYSKDAIYLVTISYLAALKRHFGFTGDDLIDLAFKVADIQEWINAASTLTEADKRLSLLEEELKVEGLVLGEG